MTATLAGWRLEWTKDRPGHGAGPGEHAEPASSHALFVVPRGHGDGFEASIRGHVLELADPASGSALAPTPHDLLIVSLASELAWTARTVLRDGGLPDDVSVAAEWRTQDDPPRLAEIDLTVLVPRGAAGVSTALTDAFETSLAARTLDAPTLNISLEGASR